MVVAARLYECMSDRPEGDLAKTKSVVVSEGTLSQIALDIGMPDYLILGKGELMSGGNPKSDSCRRPRSGYWRALS